MKALTIASYQWQDLLRDLWLVGYALIYLLMTDALIRFGGGGAKALLSLSNIMLLLVPLVSLIYGVLYLYQSREFIELLLAQPLDRGTLFGGLFAGVAVPLCLAFLLGTGLPLLYTGAWVETDPGSLAAVFGLGIGLSLVFTGIGFLFGLRYFDDKIKGFGFALVTWLFLAVLYDGLILLFLGTFGDYPLENAMIALSLANPIDLARIAVLIEFDISALMGYTGAVFSRFFGSSLGLLTSIACLALWIVGPVWRAKSRFSKRDF